MHIRNQGLWLKYLPVLLLVCIVLSTAACGRKAPPRWTNPLRPPTVEDLRLYQRPGEVLLRWDYPEAAASAIKRFEVKRAADSGEASTVGKTKETSFRDTGVEEGKIYTYSIVAHTDVAKSRRASIETAEEGGPPPPHDLAIRATADSLELTWSHADPRGLFNVYRSTVPGTEFFTPVGPPVRGTTTAVRMDLDTPVYFTVRAVAPGTPRGVTSESAPSNEVMLDPATLVPPAVTGLRVLAANGGAVLLWDESPELWVRAYRVYRAGVDGAFGQIGEAHTPTYNDVELPEEGGPWFYRVSAVGPGGEGPPSETVAAPPPEPEK
jgi:hypothetical protein